MTEKRYLNWYNKVGYGSGDIAGNVVYAFLTFFVMIYLSDTIGLNTGIVGTLMAVAKIFDGVSDVIFGSLIDKTKTNPALDAVALSGLWCLPVRDFLYSHFLGPDRSVRLLLHLLRDAERRLLHRK